MLAMIPPNVAQLHFLRPNIYLTASNHSLGATDTLHGGHGHAVQGDKGREAGVGRHVLHGSLFPTAFQIQGGLDRCIRIILW